MLFKITEVAFPSPYPRVKVKFIVHRTTNTASFADLFFGFAALELPTFCF